MAHFNSVLLVFIGILASLYVVRGQLNLANAYCFHFTWLGPRYTNESLFGNATCTDATSNANNIPCREPLVASYDGSRPDTEYIWENHAEQASCTLASTDVCVTYSYIFDGRYENTTHMCTQVIDVGVGSITNGCYEENSGGRITRVCVCRSLPGGRPCNLAPRASAGIFLCGLIFVAAMLLRSALFDPLK